MPTREQWERSQEPLYAVCRGWPLDYTQGLTEPGHELGAGRVQAHMACARCHQSVIVLTPDMRAGVGHRWTVELELAQVVRHVREVHCDGGGNLLPP